MPLRARRAAPTQDPGTPVELVILDWHLPHTLWMRSPQRGATVDQGDGPADVGVRWQLADSWVVMESLHTLLEAGGRRKGKWQTDGAPQDKGPWLGSQPCKTCDPYRGAPAHLDSLSSVLSLLDPGSRCPPPTPSRPYLCRNSASPPRQQWAIRSPNSWLMRGARSVCSSSSCMVRRVRRG